MTVDGFARIITWVTIAYWLGLVLDYLPVAAGSTELPRAARLVLLLAVGAVGVYLLFRYVLACALARLTPQSLARLLERRFPELDDTLLTAISSLATR